MFRCFCMFLLIFVNSCFHCNCRMKYQLRLVDEKDEILTSIVGGNIISYTAMCFMNKISNFMKKVRWLKTPRKWNTPPKANMEPNTWWFVDVSPFPRGYFQVPAVSFWVFSRRRNPIFEPPWETLKGVWLRKGLSNHRSRRSRKRQRLGIFWCLGAGEHADGSKILGIEFRVPGSCVILMHFLDTTVWRFFLGWGGKFDSTTSWRFNLLAVEFAFFWITLFISICNKSKLYINTIIQHTLFHFHIRPEFRFHINMCFQLKLASEISIGMWLQIFGLVFVSQLGIVPLS